jgi:hypothetical protein
VVHIVFTLRKYSPATTQPPIKKPVGNNKVRFFSDERKEVRIRLNLTNKALTQARKQSAIFRIKFFVAKTNLNTKLALSGYGIVMKL